MIYILRFQFLSFYNLLLDKFLFHYIFEILAILISSIISTMFFWFVRNRPQSRTVSPSFIISFSRYFIGSRDRENRVLDGVHFSQHFDAILFGVSFNLRSCHFSEISYIRAFEFMFVNEKNDRASERVSEWLYNYWIHVVTIKNYWTKGIGTMVEYRHVTAGTKWSGTRNDVCFLPSFLVCSGCFLFPVSLLSPYSLSSFYPSFFPILPLVPSFNP